MFLDRKFISQTHHYFYGKGNDTGGHYTVRALASLYERNTASSDLREYIKAYISVQVSLHTKFTSPGLQGFGRSTIPSLSRPGPQTRATFMGHPGQDHQAPCSMALYRPTL